MKKILSTVLATAFLATAMLTGCAGGTTESDDLAAKVCLATEKSEYEGDIPLMTLVFTNNSDKQVYLANDFTIEVKENNEWKELEEKTHFIEDILFSVNAGKEAERDYGVADAYGTLTQGEYRIGIDVSFDEKMADDKTEILYAQFSVK